MKRTLLSIAVCVPLMCQGKTYYGDQFSTRDLGLGYSEAVHKGREKCLTGNIIRHPRGSGRLDFYNFSNTTNVKRRTFGEVHAGINLFIIAGSASTSMYHSNATDNLSVTSSMHFFLDEGYSSIEDRNLVPDWQSKDCGDSFLYQVNYGRDIFLNAKLHFRSEADYKRFVTKIKIRVLFFKKTITKVKEYQKYAANAVFTLDVNSNGALPAELETILAASPVVCKGSNISPCLDTVTTISDYLFGDAGLAQDIGELSPVVRSVKTARYEKSGHYEVVAPAPPNQDQVFAILSRVEARYGELVREEQRAKAFYLVAEGDDDKAEALAHWQETSQTRIQFEVTRSECFASPLLTRCQVI